jgi:hypothetical protein
MTLKIMWGNSMGWNLHWMDYAKNCVKVSDLVKLDAKWEKGNQRGLKIGVSLLDGMDESAHEGHREKSGDFHEPVKAPHVQNLGCWHSKEQ